MVKLMYESLIHTFHYKTRLIGKEKQHKYSY